MEVTSDIGEKSCYELGDWGGRFVLRNFDSGQINLMTSSLSARALPVSVHLAQSPCTAALQHKWVPCFSPGLQAAAFGKFRVWEDLDVDGVALGTAGDSEGIWGRRVVHLENSQIWQDHSIRNIVGPLSPLEESLINQRKDLHGFHVILGFSPKMSWLVLPYLNSTLRFWCAKKQWDVPHDDTAPIVLQSMHH